MGHTNEGAEHSWRKEKFGDGMLSKEGLREFCSRQTHGEARGGEGGWEEYGSIHYF